MSLLGVFIHYIGPIGSLLYADAIVNTPHTLGAIIAACIGASQYKAVGSNSPPVHRTISPFRET